MNPDDAMYFMPIQAGILSPKNQNFTFTEGLCFQNTKFSYSHTGSSDKDIGDVILTIETDKPETLLCKDWFLFGTAEV